ncbi:MAG: c-type cytochrome [Hyphomicrobiales bacterium]
MKFGLAFSVLAVLLTGQFVHAHSGATGIVLERMQLMKSVGSAMKSVGGMVSGKQEYNAEIVMAAANEIAGHGANIEGLFPDTKESRENKVSEAAPAIWEKQKEFLEEAAKMIKAAEKLAAESGDKTTTTEAFKELGGTCKSCHESFRIKK